MYPKLKFIINKNRDLKTLVDFLKQAKFINMERDLDWAFYNSHPKLKNINKKKSDYIEKKNEFKKYIDQYYLANSEKIKYNTKEIKEKWESMELKFFKIIDNLFKRYSWSIGKYIAYPTIWEMYPRFLENKTFQFPYIHSEENYAIFVIAHEMLHFIFYDYFYNHSPQYKKNELNFFVWNISEIFNSVIQNLSEWKNTIGGKTLDYPEHKKIIKILNKKYYNKSRININNLINDILKSYQE